MFVLIVDNQGILKETVLNLRKEGKQSREQYCRQRISLDRKWVLERGPVEADREVIQVDQDSRDKCLL